APVRDLQIRAVASKMPSVAASPLLRRLDALDLSSNFLDPGQLSALFASPHLGGLRSLALRRVVLRPEGARVLAQWPHLARLRRLELGNNYMGRDTVDALAGAPLTEMRYLSLANSLISAEILDALAESAPALEHLDISSCTLTTDAPALCRL